MDPFSLIAMGLGTAGSLYGGIKSAIEAPKKKREFLREQARLAKIQALRNSGRMMDVDPNNPFAGDYDVLDAREKQRQVQKYADEAFDVDPMAFVPFVGQATQLAGAIYDGFKGEPQKPVPTRSGARMTADEFMDPSEVRGPSSGARMGMSDFYDPDELRYWQGRR